jgi:cholesterol oxidase
VVVVGSGYGGSIAASRLARAGLSVCLLERGRELRPGDFPESAEQGMREIQMDWPNRRVGSRLGLFDFRINPDISVLSGCGLGGTSLINANVAIEADPRTWLDPLWPEALREDVETRLAQGILHARTMLRPVPFPDTLDPPRKLLALGRSASRMGAAFHRVPIAVNFEDGPNHVGVEQAACNGCGNCVGGCNTGSKNTLLANYLPDARHHGAHIFTGTRVSRVEKQGRRWLVRFEVLGTGSERFGTAELFVAADTVVVAAGSLGSTEILLRSRAAGLPLSDRLGHGFTGNGDVLGFAYNADVPVSGIGTASNGRAGPGPCITGVIDLRGGRPFEEGMIIEEGTIPSTLAATLASAMFVAARVVGRDTDSGIRDYLGEKAREIQALVPGGSRGAIENTQTFLVMAHDDAGGRLHLEDDRLRISWPGVGKQEVFERIDRELYRATAALGGTYLKNPLWTERAGNSLITVHPLGGCPMAETAEQGVVDHRGLVFASAAGGEVHDGLYVCDGAVMPRSLGVNPLLTISAFAERTCQLLAEERGFAIPYELPHAVGRPRAKARVLAARSPGGAPPGRAPEPAPSVGIQFTERMTGFLLPAGFELAPGGELGRTTQAGQAGESGEPAGTAGQERSHLEFTLTVTSDDLQGMLASPEHRARLHGTVVAPWLSPEPMTVTRGTFELLTRDLDDPGARRMSYRIPLETSDGRRYYLEGFKHIKDDPGFDVWSDTTTLFVTLHQGEDGGAPVLGKGVLRIRPKDFAKQLRTMRVTNAGSLKRRLQAARDFGRFFAGELYDTYLSPRSKDPT